MNSPRRRTAGVSPIAVAALLGAGLWTACSRSGDEAPPQPAASTITASEPLGTWEETRVGGSAGAARVGPARDSAGDDKASPEAPPPPEMEIDGLLAAQKPQPAGPAAAAPAPPSSGLRPAKRGYRGEPADEAEMDVPQGRMNLRLDAPAPPPPPTPAEDPGGLFAGLGSPEGKRVSAERQVEARLEPMAKAEEERAGEGRFDDADDDRLEDASNREPAPDRAMVRRRAASKEAAKSEQGAKQKDKKTGTLTRIPIEVLDGDAEPEPQDEVRPARFLPRMFYFENTYLAGNAAIEERLRRARADLPNLNHQAERWHSLAGWPSQPLDPPQGAGLGLSVNLDRRGFERPGRVILQVGLRGSDRFGWRRPPLDLVVVLDSTTFREGDGVAVIEALLDRLSPTDRLGVVVAGHPPRVLLEPTPPRDSRRLLAERLVAPAAPLDAGSGALAAAMDHAGDVLAEAAEGQARVPGSQTILLVTRLSDPSRVAGAAAAAHRLTLRGAVTSVLDTAGSGAWWSVAAAGNGAFHRVGGDLSIPQAVEAELATQARVIARLLRLNIRLAEGVEAIRVLGSRQLSPEEVAALKAREEAVDRQISKSMGVKADRGDDDDGIQTVVPYFFGGDSHVVLVELWVDRPGPIAEVTLKYKDMVTLGNATAQAAARMEAVSRPATELERWVRRNARGAVVAEVLQEAAYRSRRGDNGEQIMALLRAEVARIGAGDVHNRALLHSAIRMVESGGAERAGPALELAGRLRVGRPAPMDATEGL